jgi:tRNA dimethylallyltransferase
MSIRNRTSDATQHCAPDTGCNQEGASRQVLLIVGPTASGKTEVSIHLAKRLDGEIISADSRQIYKHLDIGTAKPTREQLSSVKHHFIDELLPDQEFNAAEFGERGRRVVDDIFSRNKTPIVVGGSGLYVQSLIDGLFEGPSADKEFRRILENRIASGELPALLEELAAVDPISAQRIDPTKPRRIIRALEVFHATGKPLSVHHKESRTVITFAPIMFGLEWKRATLYERINRRCDEMIERGILQEIEKLESLGYDSSLNALNTVGYAEGFAYRRGEISFEEMQRLFKQNSRRYAKRQMTWFRRDKRIRWVRVNDDSALPQVTGYIASTFTGA